MPNNKEIFRFVLLGMLLLSGEAFAQRPSTNPVMEQFTCHGDWDCVSKGRTCTIRKTPMGQQAMAEGYHSTGNCVCLMGPVMYGCVPRTQNAPQTQEQKDNFRQ